MCLLSSSVVQENQLTCTMKQTQPGYPQRKWDMIEVTNNQTMADITGHRTGRGVNLEKQAAKYSDGNDDDDELEMDELENNNSGGNCSGDDNLEDVHLNNDNNEDEMHMDTTDNQQLINEPTHSAMVDASCQTDPEVTVIDKQEWDALQQQKDLLQSEVQKLQMVVDKVQLSEEVLKEDDARVLKLYTGEYLIQATT